MTRQITRSALSWLRETDTLEMETLKRAYWEDLRLDPESYGVVAVANHSHADPAEHTHTVGVNQHGIVHHCSCAQFEYRNTVCKHMVATAMAIDDGNLDLEPLGVKEDVIERATPRV